MRKNRLFGLVVVLGVLMGFTNLGFAASPASVMRKIQARYNWLVKENSAVAIKYYDWGDINGKPIPSFPLDSFFESCEDESVLATKIRNAYNGVLRGRFYEGTPEGKESIDEAGCIDYTAEITTSIDTIDGWLDDMKYYAQGANGVNDEKDGYGDDYTITELNGNCIYVNHQAVFSEAANEAIGDLNDIFSCSHSIGVYLAVTSYEDQCNDNCNGTYECRAYSVFLVENRGTLTSVQDYYDHDNVTVYKYYIKLHQGQSYGGCGSSGSLACPDGTTETAPVTVDDKFHIYYSMTPGGGSPPPLFNSHPSITKGNYAKGWMLSSSVIFVEPIFQEDSDTVADATAVEKKIYKTKDEYTIYSAYKDCGFDAGETIHGKAIPPTGDNLSYQIKIEDYKTSVANLSIGEPTSCWISYSPDDFSITAYVGETNIDFTVRTWEKTTDNDGKITVGKGDESFNFQVKTNGYECCNRMASVNESDSKPTLTKQENGDVEIYFPDIEQSYIWGSYTEFMSMYYGYSKTCAFIGESISDYDTDEILVSNSGSNGLVYNASSNWGTSGSSGSASFDREIGDNGNAVSSATYDTSGRLSKIAQAVNPTNLYRQFYYGNTGYPNRVTSYTDIAGNLSRTYTVVYDEATGKASGTIGGSGSGCSSCCSSGDNILYTFNNDGYVLTESDLTGSIIHEYQYDSQNRLINKWLGDKDNLRPVQEVIYDTNNASSYGGYEIQDIYDYIDGDNYHLTRNILIADGKVITQIQFDNLNVDSQNISTDPNTIIANGGYITTYEYLYNAVITKSPEFNAGLTSIYRKQTFRSSGSGNEEDILITVDANNNETETVLSRNSYSDNLLTTQYSWYDIQFSGYSSNSYYSNKRLAGYSQAGASQLNGYYTQAYNNYTYHPDGRLNTEQSGNSGDVDTMLITTSVYDDINQPAGTIVTDCSYNVLYETFSKSNGFGDVIYTIDKTGVAAGKEYDNGGKIISEFVFAEPNDTALFDNASFSDISSVYEDVSVVSQTKYIYDTKGRLTYTYTAVDDGIFDYNSPDSWNITTYGYDDYGRKTSQIVDVDGLALVTEYQYNNQGQLEKTIYPDSHWVKQIYNGRGLVEATIEGYGSESTDPNDFVITETVYDADGRVFKTIKGGIVTASFEYDELGNIYRQYQGDFETEYCSFVQFDRNYAGDVLNQKFVNVNSTTAVETVIQQIDYRYNGRGEKIEERVITDPNDDPEGESQSNDFTDGVRLFSYDHFGNTVEVVTKTDDANGIYTDEYMNCVNYQEGDSIEQNYYDLTSQLEYSVKFDCKERCYYDQWLMQNVCNVLIDFEDINDVLCYAKDTRDIYIVRYNYLDGKLDSTDVLADYNEAHPDFDDYQYYQNIDAGLVWKTSSAYEYDKAGRTFKSFDADDNFTTIKYNSLNLPTEQILWQGKNILRFNDSNGYDPSFIPYPVRTSLTEYNNLGSKTKTAVLYDPNSINDINGIDDVNLAVDNVISYVYDANGNLYREKEFLEKSEYGDDLSAIKEYSYDSLGRVSQILYGELSEIDFYGTIYEGIVPLKYIGYHYNGMGQMDTQTVTDVNTIDLETPTTVSFDTYYSYDNQGRVKEIQNAIGILGQYFYDSAGRKVKEVDFAGMVTVTNYNGLGYLTSTVEDANNQQPRTTTFGYDRNGRKTSISSGNDSTVYTYNYLDKITNIEYPDDKEIAYGCNMEGNVISRTVTQNSTSVTTNYKRDVLGRVCYKQYSNDPNWSDPNTFWPFDEILYDAAGNKWLMSNIDDGNDSEFICFTYDGLGNMVLSSEIYPEMNYNISYSYDTRGLLKTIQYPNGKIVTYTRDALGRVETVSYDANAIAQYYYLGDKVVKKTIGGIEYTATIDSLGRIGSEGYGGLTFDYSYLNYTSRLTSRNTVDYGYDTLGRVDSEESTSYTCDLLGNPTNAGNDGLTYTLDNEDRITEVADGSTAVAYYSYDRTGRRISKTVDEVKTYFAYDKSGNIIAEYIRDGNETVWQRDYVYGANGELIYMDFPLVTVMETTEEMENFINFCDAWLCSPDCTTADLEWDYNSDSQINFIDYAAYMEEFEVMTNNSRHYILTDFMNSVVGISDGSSFIEITYNAWGVPSYAGDLAGLNILWNGYYSDEETGNYYLRNRYYSPLERRFITEDPRGINPDGNWNNPLNIESQYIDGYGLMVYTGGNPVNKRDDWGLFARSINRAILGPSGSPITAVDNGSMSCPCSKDIFKRTSYGYSSGFNGAQAFGWWLNGSGKPLWFNHRSSLSSSVANSSSLQSQFNAIEMQLKFKAISESKSMPPKGCSTFGYKQNIGGYSFSGLLWTVLGRGEDNSYSRFKYQASCCIEKNCPKVKWKCSARFILDDKYTFDDSIGLEYNPLKDGMNYWIHIRFYKDFSGVENVTGK